MPRRLQKSASFLSLLIYGAIGLLGYGLHYFSPCCDHHATLAANVDCCGCGDHSCNALANSQEADSPGGASLRENDHDADSCPVCAVLTQAKASSFSLLQLNLEIGQTGHAASDRSTLNAESVVWSASARGPPAFSA